MHDQQCPTLDDSERGSAGLGAVTLLGASAVLLFVVLPLLAQLVNAARIGGAL